MAIDARIPLSVRPPNLALVYEMQQNKKMADARNKLWDLQAQEAELRLEQLRQGPSEYEQGMNEFKDRFMFHISEIDPYLQPGIEVGSNEWNAVGAKIRARMDYRQQNGLSVNGVTEQAMQAWQNGDVEALLEGSAAMKMAAQRLGLWEGEPATDQSYSNIKELPGGGLGGVRNGQFERIPGSEGYQFGDSADTPEIKEDVNGRLRYVRTGELVFPNVTPIEEVEKGDSLETEEGLRKELNTLLKDFYKVADSYARVEASASDPSAAGDLALIFNYMKMLDPGSTVREGEFATAQNAAGVPGRIVSLYNNILEGQRMNDTQRADFMTRSAKLFQAAQGSAQAHADAYLGIAERAGVNPQNVIAPFTSRRRTNQNEPPPPPGTVPLGSG